ncbi:MAG: FAD-dependent thymidylate synthase [Clostridiales bacterium]|jgi:thymidylate synthase (FAD)|nr:FAD-dependent thymidylate synthase [Clostridiales bacterium]
MRIVEPRATLETPIDGDALLRGIERIGRVCYKSEAKISRESAEKFVRGIIKRGHESVIEHASVSFRIVCDRGVTHEIVRHRIASYSQESTRYCNYAGDKFGGELTFIKPCFFDEGGAAYRLWHESMSRAETAYLALIGGGASPQEARSVLPNSLKTEIVVTMNLREWRHFIRLRTAADAHPQVREVAFQILKELRARIPVIFDEFSQEQ